MVKIRRAKQEEARKISILRRKTIKQLLSKEYHPKIINHLLESNRIKGILKNLKKRKVFCLWDKKKLLGTIDIYKKKRHYHVGGLYVKVGEIGRGHGKILMDFIENYATKKGVKKLRLYPTSFARNFYKKRGYKKIDVHIAWKEFSPTKVLEMEKNLK